MSIEKKVWRHRRNGKFDILPSFSYAEPGTPANGGVEEQTFA